MKSARQRGTYIASRGYRGGKNLWGRGFGYGYGAYWAFRYPWVARSFPYEMWFPNGDWIPYYTVDENYAIAYDNNGEPLPPEAYQINSAFGNVQLPPLPTFESLGIDLMQVLQEPAGAFPTEQESAQRQAVQEKISAELERLRQQYAAQNAQGYFVVPDLDRGQFSWLKRV